MPTLIASPSQLRVLFPEFSDLTKYPNSVMELWLGIAAGFVNVEKWGEQAPLGIMLYAAHKMTLMASGGPLPTARPGQVRGVMTSKSADGLSVSYDISSVMNEGAGHWNLTVYGLQFWQLSRLFGAGPVQIGITSPSPTGLPWQGVMYPPF